MIRLLKIKEDKTQDEKYIEMIRDYFSLIDKRINQTQNKILHQCSSNN